MRILFVTLFVVIADQLSKLYIKGISIPALNIHFTGMSIGERIDVIGSFLRITFVENPGMAFGIDLGVSSKLFLSLFSIIASIGILYYLYKVRHNGLILRLSLALILGGALGNLIDRVFYGVIFGYSNLFFGRVVDFIDVDFFNINLLGYNYDRWPIFNVADMSVSIGVIMLLLFSKSFSKEQDREKELKTSEVSLYDESGLVVAKGQINDPALMSSYEDNQDFGINKNTPAEENNNLNKKANGKPDNGEEIQV